MATVAANGIELEYEEHGDSSGSPLVMVNGFGTQLVSWEWGFLEALVERGLRIVVFDNRDSGLSTKLDAAGVPDVARVALGEAGAPYTLADMADDTAALATALGIGRFVVLGASMGGMIAQLVTIRHPAAVSGLVSIFSTTGSPELPPPTPEALEALLAAPPETREERVEANVRLSKLLGSPGFEFREDDVRARAIAAEDRCFCPDGATRQMAAILASRDRTEALGGVEVPALVLHGEADPIIPVEHGRATAAAIPGAILRTYPGWGHDLPAELWAGLADEIASHVAQALGANSQL